MAEFGKIWVLTPEGVGWTEEEERKKKKALVIGPFGTAAKKQFIHKFESTPPWKRHLEIVSFCP